MCYLEVLAALDVAIMFVEGEATNCTLHRHAVQFRLLSSGWVHVVQLAHAYKNTANLVVSVLLFQKFCHFLFSTEERSPANSRTVKYISVSTAWITTQSQSQSNHQKQMVRNTHQPVIMARQNKCIFRL